MLTMIFISSVGPHNPLINEVKKWQFFQEKAELFPLVAQFLR